MNEGEFAGADDTARFSDDLIPTSQDGLSAEEISAISALPSGSALLIVRRGPGAGSRFLLDQDVTLAGRHPNADIFLDDVTVSRRHAEFLRSGTQFAVRDLGSMNGTYCEGHAVESAALAHGSEVQVGKFRLTFYGSKHDGGAE